VTPAGDESQPSSSNSLKNLDDFSSFFSSTEEKELIPETVKYSPPTEKKRSYKDTPPDKPTKLKRPKSINNDNLNSYPAHWLILTSVALFTSTLALQLKSGGLDVTTYL
jgi:hypothetical protein